MKLETQSVGANKSLEVVPGEFGDIVIRIGREEIHLMQVEALSLARMIEEQVKDIRRK